MTKATTTRLWPQRLPTFAGALSAIEWTTDIASLGNGGFPAGFRMLVGYIGAAGGGTWLTNIQNLNGVFSDDDYGGPATTTPGRSIGISSQFESLPLQDGASFNDNSSVYPRFGRLFNNEPPYAGPTETWKSIAARTQLTIPTTIKWSAVRIGTATDPAGNVDRARDDGSWQALSGTFTLWNVRVSIDGIIHDLGTYYLPTARVDALSATGPFAIQEEYFYDPLPLSNEVTTVHYSGIRLFDGTSWHDVLEWQINATGDNSDPEHGFTAQVVPGKITAHCGVGINGEYAVNRYVLSGLTYEENRSGRWAALPFAAVENRTHGGIVYNGPSWRNAPPEPYVKQDADRGFYVMHPGFTVPVACVHVAETSGVYTFTGDFARAHGLPSIGQGVDVSVVSNGDTLFSAHVDETASVDATSGTTMFGGSSNQHFAVSKALPAGAVTRFVIDAGTTQDADATAFRMSVKSAPAIVTAASRSRRSR